MTALWVEITRTRGSAPRDAGTAMKVTATDTQGTIGGGALEHAAIATARAMLARGARDRTETLPLGPRLGQCCGGSVSLRYTAEPVATDRDEPPAHFAMPVAARPVDLWLWGAGHVGRAVARAAPPQVFRVTWIDTAADRFPQQVAPHIRVVPTPDMPRLAAHAPKGAHHLIFTYSHDIDFALCAALLQNGAASIGLIGSDTKWTRFGTRLRALGLDPAPITCPIGDKALGKTPAQIAQGTVAALLSLTRSKVSA